MKTRKQAIEEEFNDLEQEFFFCPDQGGRRRCASRMQAILAELALLLRTGICAKPSCTGAGKGLP